MKRTLLGLTVALAPTLASAGTDVYRIAEPLHVTVNNLESRLGKTSAVSKRIDCSYLGCKHTVIEWWTGEIYARIDASGGAAIRVTLSDQCLAGARCDLVAGLTHGK